MVHEDFKQYWKKVEQHLTCSRSARKKFYRQTLEAANRFLDEQPDLTFDQVEEYLGSPQELAQNYLDTLSPKDLSLFRERKKLALCATMAVILLLVCLTVGLWLAKRDAVIISVETEIIDEGNISLPENSYAEE